MTSKQASRWVDALRSGKYKQTTGTLQDICGHCCLGVACEIFIKPEDQNRNEGGYLLGTTTDDQPEAPKFLNAMVDDSKKTIGRSIFDLNDGVFATALTFDEIADVIQAVYLLEVLGD